MIYRLEKAQPEGMRITKKGEPLPLKYYNSVVRSRLAVGMHPTNKGAYDTGLSEAQQKAFEEEIGLDEGTLAPRSSYWADFGIFVNADGSILDDTFPEDKLKIHILRRRKDVAKSQHEVKTKAGIKWLLTSEEMEAEIEADKRTSLTKALMAFDSMSEVELKEYLEAQKIDTSNMSPSVIRAKVGSDAEKKPKNFLLLVKDERKADKIFMHELVKFGVLRLNGAKYINEDNVPLAFNDDDMLVFLASKENTAQVATWKKQLNAAKKNK